MAEKQKQSDLKKISSKLMEISEEKTTQELQSIYDSILSCFNRGYKINYSDSYQIAKQLTLVEENNEYVFKNLSLLIDRSQRQGHLLDMHKLLDYTLLECTRCVEHGKSMRDSEASLKELQLKHSKLNEETKKLNKEIELARGDLEKSQISAITVIGLFSAIIMSFFGGISFSGQALTALSMASPVRLVFVLSLIGFILFNLLFLILYIVGKLTGKPICSPCLKSTDDTKKVCTCDKQSLWCKFIRRYPYVLWTNVVLLFLLVDMAAIWISTLFFYRNFNSTWVVIITGAISAIFVVTLGVLYFKVKIKKSDPPKSETK